MNESVTPAANEIDPVLKTVYNSQENLKSNKANIIIQSEIEINNHTEKSLTTFSGTSDNLNVSGRSFDLKSGWEKAVQIATTRLNELVSAQPREITGNFQQMVESVNQNFSRQERINQLNLQLNYANYISNIAAISSNKALKKQFEESQMKIASLVSTIRSHEESIQELTENIQCLNFEVEDQRSKSMDLTFSLDHNKKELEETKKKFESEIKIQKEMIESYQNSCKQLEKQMTIVANREVKKGLMLNSLLFTVCLIIVNTSLVDFPLSLILSIFTRNKSRFRDFLNHLTKFIMALIMFAYSRRAVKSDLKMSDVVHFLMSRKSE